MTVRTFNIPHATIILHAARLLTLILFVFCATTWAEEAESFDICNEQQTRIDPSSKHLGDNGLIDSITVNVHPIFDESNPDENNWLFRSINYLHINTRKSVIEKDLLFKANDPYDEKLIEESERVLRTRRYLNSASVVAKGNCSLSIPIAVDVREVWTLIPTLTFSHTAGNSNYSFGLHDSNFLGLGKKLQVLHSTTIERTGDVFAYYDPNTGAYDSTLAFQYADNDDGIHKSIELVKPFVPLDTEWSSGILYENFEQEDTLYNAGEEVDRFAHYNDSKSIFYGRKILHSTRESIHRVVLGYNTIKDNFTATGTPPDSSVLVPTNREFAYPWIEYQHVTDRYIEAYNIREINRIEDINLGGVFNFRIGYGTAKFKTLDHAYVINTGYKQAFSLSENQFLLAELTAKGYYGDNEFHNTIVQNKMSYHWKDFSRGQFYIGITAARGFHLFEDAPLELGGDTGLRGYPVRYEAGNHLKLITIEQRYYGEREWLSLFHMGAAVFYDEGRVWGETGIPQDQTQSVRNIGIGLRISGTRTGNAEEGEHNILHIDIASPLDGGKDISKTQLTIKVKKGF
jgi:outer membrane protein assembly factor BamA